MDKDYDIILKLFEQVKDSSDRTDKEIVNLTATIKELLMGSLTPSHGDISLLIKDLQKCFDGHDRVVDEPIKNISEMKTDMKDVNKVMQNLLSRIKTMIVIVCVAFSIMGVSYLFVNNSIKTMVQNQVDKLSQEEVVTHEHNEELLKKLKELYLKLEEYDRDKKNNETTKIYK